MSQSESSPPASVDRRDFLRKSVAAAAGIAVAGSRAAGADDSAPARAEIPTRTLGKSGPRLPILAYGGAGLPRAWGNPLSTEDRVKLVRHAYDRGVRYFDTAGNYMESQSIIGEALKDVRAHVHLTSKVEATVVSRVRANVDKALRELQTDHLDTILIHGTPGLEQMSVERAMEIHGELVGLREEGIVHSIGFSAHSYFGKALALITSGGFDLCMLSYGYLPRGHDQVFSAQMVELRNTCLAKAHERGMGIVAMKVVGAGILGAWSGHVVPGFDRKRLAKLPGAAIRYVLDDERVHLLAIGMRLESEVDANIETLSGDVTYTEDDRALLAEYAAKALSSETMRSMKVE